jgi:anaerobic selenocysteine-containing dehydrogenase
MAKAKTSHESNTTTNHDEIKKWVEERGGKPAIVRGTEKGDSALLRIDYPGYSGEDTLEAIEWDEFFEIFDENKLAFLYQEKTQDGGESRFSKFVSRSHSGH